ncbi:MAG: protein-ADP-ribose hydrolase [Helicobacteraceae bacterium]|jgi:O-acetyl-ADP-ribose deacetylase (regulator of RNase III)|nr:protein-ADP-ribose hydrolase [Helicobacteraceae bacterium]
MNKNERLETLIKELSSAEIPYSFEDKWRLFRSLVNVRKPKPISREFLKIQDELLQSLIKEKGVTAIDELRPIKDNIYLWQGDITTLKIGAIVNAANSGMLGCFAPCHACIDNVIHTFAGVQLRLECAEIMKKQGYSEPTGRAKITKAYNLPCDYILHTVGAIVLGELTETDCKILSSCYRSCLELAEENGVNSIAFCCISTGEFHFPNEKAAEIAIDAVTRFIGEKQSGIKIVFNVFKDFDYEIYKRLLGKNS